MALGLPPVSVGLKAIAPFLQRAEELVEREPVIAYWCAYYAAQVGISLKAKDAASRTLLFGLLTALERLKNEIGPNDAIDMEAASAAYVENFALKVFKMADDEDRAGRANKSTAKKFLAASNFFEVLKIFPKSEVSEATESKLRYAQWKAADIAKAFREGRKPNPGPAAPKVDPELVTAELAAPLHPQRPQNHSLLSHNLLPHRPKHSVIPLRQRRHSPPPQLPAADITRANDVPIYGDGRRDEEVLTPGRWSTTATPGYELTHEHALEGIAEQDEISQRSTPISGSPPRATVGRAQPPSTSPPRRHSPRLDVTLPPGFVPTGPPVPEYATPCMVDTRDGIAETFVSPVSPVALPSHPIHAAVLPPLPPPVPASELSPSMVAMAQKHCRFAISSLDYEDVEQARKELLVALGLLGGLRPQYEKAD
ncbi:Vta1 like-domain-containing protein [Pisolithus orientalis]|uniref:Vta1 like-domain-containing protein n=1 Tax=Pisolithus orientalis TaxID=936130 RepID=UPI002224DB91|nr:Vta1 like-domain-containing protein [Pisolithus orientalis]KAI6012467.1 Vta1 like-domain-containing protein [Pisolithus orientalis]